MDHEETVIRHLASTFFSHIPSVDDDLLSDTEDELRAKLNLLPEAEQKTSFLRPAFDILAGERCVQHTTIPFPPDGPSSMYMALFDHRPCFDNIRRNFFETLSSKDEVLNSIDELRQLF